MKSHCTDFSLSCIFVANAIRLHDAVPVEILRAFIQRFPDNVRLHGRKRIPLLSHLAQCRSRTVQPFGQPRNQPDAIYVDPSKKNLRPKPKNMTLPAGGTLLERLTHGEKTSTLRR
ncbi:hypothetical protein [Escherichia coli]|uniref:hypothetical protein n=1 Tax=Escherichia coli TaxID=562 RepID=UPI002022CD93|nr:hypothetical protein [Escherichia coli]